MSSVFHLLPTVLKFRSIFLNGVSNHSGRDAIASFSCFSTDSIMLIDVGSPGVCRHSFLKVAIMRNASNSSPFLICFNVILHESLYFLSSL